MGGIHEAPKVKTYEDENRRLWISPIGEIEVDDDGKPVMVQVYDKPDAYTARWLASRLPHTEEFHDKQPETALSPADDPISTEIPAYGEQEQSAYNGHFECTCYHPPPHFRWEAAGERCGAR
jgi:hypothetical protein